MLESRVIIDENLNQTDHVNEIAPKLITSNAIIKITIIRKHCDPSFIPSSSYILHTAVLSGVAQNFPKKVYQFFKWNPKQFCILKYTLLRKIHSLLRAIAWSLFLLIMYLLVCAIVTYMCCNVFVLLVMWMVLYSFIIDIIFWFINCYLLIYWFWISLGFAEDFFVKNVRFRYHWGD